MNTKIKILIFLLLLGLLDTIIPIPFTTILLIYVLLEKPNWFRDLVTNIYQDKHL
jgi:hypothetical protein